ncbi:major capsid protein [Microbacterium oleivorans]|uniref:major capsid protein n=1 Tax=Microbacterium oleivorans TaxID=273677 RepID=UPI00344AB4B2
MAVTLAQAALLSENDLQRGVLEVFVQEASVLDRIPLLDIEGNAYAYNKEATLPGVAFRSVNEAYTESTGTVVQATESLVILGGDADVDTFIQQTRSNINDQRAIQTRLKVKAAAYKYQDAFFNGDVTVDPKGFDGLKKRLIGNQVIDAGVNGLPILGSSNADIYAFFDKLDELVAAVPGLTAENGAIYAPRGLRSKVLSAGRRIGGTEMVKEDLTGKRVATWNGIPLLDPGDNLAGAQILAQNETQGTANNAASIYAVKFGEDEADAGVTGLTNGGVSVRDLGEVDDKPALRTRIEFFCGLATFGGKSAARLRGVLNG